MEWGGEDRAVRWLPVRRTIGAGEGLGSAKRECLPVGKGGVVEAVWALGKLVVGGGAEFWVEGLTRPIRASVPDIAETDPGAQESAGEEFCRLVYPSANPSRPRWFQRLPTRRVENRPRGRSN